MTEEAALPEFAIAMRGYDRLQVDDYIVKQTVWLNEARARMETAEAELAAARSEALTVPEGDPAEEEHSGTPRFLEDLGERVERILKVAWESAEGVRQEGEKAAAELVRRAEEKLSQADEEVEGRARRAEKDAEAAIAKRREQVASEAEALVEEAKRESRGLVVRARAEARQVTREAERKRQELEEEITSLGRRRDSTMSELSRLRTGLEELFSSLPAHQDDKDDETIDLRGGHSETGNDSAEMSEATAASPRRRVV